MMDDDVKNTELEFLFQQARATPPQMPQGLMARVLADAEALQPAPERWGWQSWFSALGGLPGMGGLITASCVGFWLGVAPPTGMPDLAGTVLGIESTFDDDLDGGTLTAFGWDIEGS
ncbi:MAG: hypothetical protein WA782_09495 [Sulfitobacter sp.]